MQSEASTVFDLSRRLLQCGHAALLDTPLESLAQRVADTDTGELLRALVESGRARNLRDALEDDVLDAWVASTCTQREEALVLRQLSDWLDGGGLAGDDPAARMRLAPAPATEPELRSWAASHGVSDLLDSPADTLVPESPARGTSLTLLEACLGNARPLEGTSLLLEHDPVSERARHALKRAAQRRKAREARTALWAGALPDPRTHQLAQRLYSLLDSEQPESLLACRFVAAHPVSVDPTTGVARAQLWHDDGEPGPVTLLLSGFEHFAPAGECPRCDGRARCTHQQALAARLLDALYDPGDRLHAPLRNLCAEPSWRRFIAALSPGEAPATRNESGSLAFRLRLQGGMLSAGVVLRRPLSGGGLSAGKLLSPQRAARSHACRDVDAPALDAMRLSARTLSAQYVPVDLQVLRALAEHPQVLWGDSEQPLRVAEQAAELELDRQPGGLRPAVALAGASVPYGEIPAQRSYLSHHDRTTHTLWFAPLTPALRRLLAALQHFRGLLPTESYGELAPHLAQLRQVAHVSAPRELSGYEHPAPRVLLLRLTPGFDTGVDVELSSQPLPLGALWPPGQGPGLVHGLAEGQPVFARRDLDWERLAAMQVLEALELDRFQRLGAFHYRVEDQQAALSVLAAAAKQTHHLKLQWAEPSRALNLGATLTPANLSIRLFKRGKWLEAEGYAQHGETRVAFGRLLQAVRRGERFVAIEGNDYAQISEELFERLHRAQLCELDVREGQLTRLMTLAAPFLQAELGEAVQVEEPQLSDWLARAREPSSKAPALSERWQGVLRDYQAEGARWLLQRARWSPGACLADDMGLGKTLQSIVVLAARAGQGPALVVTPTSVVAGWRDELARFAPELDVHIYRGERRAQALAQARPGAVVLTSYDLLLRDEAAFAEVSFATLVLDEAQLLKNARTRRARAARAIRAEFRILLSGTPVENRLGDLWSLFELMAPGLLGSWERFRAVFAVPIERYEDTQRAEVLRQRVAPWLLRRTKGAVARELPERTEVVHTFELSKAERALYVAAENEARKRLDKRSEDASASMQVLAEITRLRQLACHPQLVFEGERTGSTKLQVLLRLLEDVVPRGHRVLLFSQFTRHLALVRAAIETRGWPQLYLDGSTSAPERARRVEAFQRGEAPLFLISLKAGGTGLNLTAADYVIHLDPWWNPAAEAQASDRAHRLGQRRPVTIVKLVAEHTIEERVVALHAHKERLAASVLEGTSSPTPLDLRTLRALLDQN